MWTLFLSLSRLRERLASVGRRCRGRESRALRYWFTGYRNRASYTSYLAPHKNADANADDARYGKVGDTLKLLEAPLLSRSTPPPNTVSDKIQMQR